MTQGRYILTSSYLCYYVCADNQFLSNLILSLLYCRVAITVVKNDVFTEIPRYNTLRLTYLSHFFI